MIKNMMVTLVVFLMMGAALEVLTRFIVPVRNLGPSFSTYDPQLGKIHKRSARIVRRTPEFTMVLTTDAHGFRRGTQSDGAVDRSVLFIGDSFTEGYGVNDGEEFPARVERMFSAGACRVRTVNAGVGDTGTGYQLKLFRRLRSEISPAVIVIQIHRNDFDDNLREGFFELDSAGNLKERERAPAGRLLRLFQPIVEGASWLNESYLIASVKQAAEVASKGGATGQLPTRSYAPNSYASQLTLRLVGELVTEAKAVAGKVIVVGIDWDDASLTHILEKQARESGANMLWIPSRASRDDLYYRTDAHWNPAGHRYVAEQLEPVMTAALGCETPRS